MRNILRQRACRWDPRVPRTATEPPRNTLPPDPQAIGETYIHALYTEVEKWLRHRASGPIGVCFSGGIDSGSVLLVTYHAMLRLGISPARLKAFTLAVDGGGDDLGQARRFLEFLASAQAVRRFRGRGFRCARRAG